MKIKNLVMNLSIGFLSFVFVVSLFFLGQEVISYRTNYHPEEDSFLYSLQQQEYAYMVEMMYRNQSAGVKTNSTYEECYAVATYYEAATYYKAYKADGNETLAQEKKEIMQEQILRMGDLSYAAEDINMILGIN